MKKYLSFSFITFFLITLIFSSCKTSNEVASNKLIQKRKYTKGFYVNSHGKGKVKTDKIVFSEPVKSSEDDLVIENISVNETDKSTKSAKISKTKEDKLTKHKREKLEDDRIVISLKDIINESMIESNKQLAKLNQKMTKRFNKADIRYSEEEPVDKKLEPLGLAGGITGLVGLLIFPLAFGIAALILSAISLAKFSKNPEKYKGKGWAIAGLILGIISVVWGIIVLAG